MGRKGSKKAKLNATNEKERIILWQKHFQELLGGVSTITSEEDNYPQMNEELNIQKNMEKLVV